ncbi:hypothetical protein TNCT_525951 [Trichonephila clavata]|uniref:Uncharacterized protein n=1 Tax=Trichonephila clavata TaxID=2740835 RepID=A0A8X6M392_TRICU|nr:hypothetical protein TNCT_525951 [Trichonephila clavata]
MKGKKVWYPPKLPRILSGTLDYKFSNISRCLCGHLQVYLQRFTSVAVWTTYLVTSVTALIPSSVLKALNFSGCLDLKFGRISVIAGIPSSVLTALQFSGTLNI